MDRQKFHKIENILKDHKDIAAFRWSKSQN